MITHYYRPNTVEEAMKILAQPDTRPLGGGTVLAQHTSENFSVMDIQALGLDTLHVKGNILEIGAAATLQAILESPYSTKAINSSILMEAPINLRSLGSIAGTLISCDGRSAFVTVMLALDAKCYWMPDQSPFITLGDLLPLRAERLAGKLITRIDIPINVGLTFEATARTPADKPIVCAALAQWPSGRTRLVLGGWGTQPTLAFDGNGSNGLLEAARIASFDSGDYRTSANYRMHVAGILTKRCLDGVNS